MAEGLNRVTLLGNLCADPELRTTQSGTAVLNLRMATNERYLDKDKTWKDRVEYHSVVIWGKRGEALHQFLTKGSSVLIEGGLRTSSYEDREGVKRYKTEVVASNVVLCGGKREGGESSPRQRREPASQGHEGEPPKDDFGYGGAGNGTDDDTPFLPIATTREPPARTLAALLPETPAMTNDELQNAVRELINEARNEGVPPAEVLSDFRTVLDEYASKLRAERDALNAALGDAPKPRAPRAAPNPAEPSWSSLTREQRMTAVLARLTEAATADEVRSALQAPRVQVQEVLGDLVTDGRATKVASGRGSRFVATAAVKS